MCKKMLNLLNIIWRDTSLENSKISFRLRSDILIEQGLLKNFKEHVNGLGVKRPLFLCDKNLETSEYFGAISINKVDDSQYKLYS